MTTPLNSPAPRLCLGILFLSLLLAGCGGNRRPQTIPVEGVVTFGGGPWPKPGMLRFTMEMPSSGMPYRPATAAFDTDGTLLNVSTFKKGDGLVPGKHQIGVECWEFPPSQLGGPPAKSYVPHRYRSPSTSGLTLTVEPNQKVVLLKLDVAKQ